MNTDSAQVPARSSSYLEEWCDVVYGKNVITDGDGTDQDMIENLIAAMPRAGDDEPIVPLSDIESGEIYAISIQNGKVRVQGGEGYYDKAAAYEKLLNASLKSGWKIWGGGIWNEGQLLNKLNDMLSYYMEIDNNIRKVDSNDSIVNHIGEAFEQWSRDNDIRSNHFERTI